MNEGWEKVREGRVQMENALQTGIGGSVRFTDQCNAEMQAIHDSLDRLRLYLGWRATHEYDATVPGWAPSLR